jgi:hypothetical protein
MTTLLPWLPVFFFGGVLALYGKYLQASEKKERLERKRVKESGSLSDRRE